MRREHNIQQSYIDWLKSMGCVFYAPLDFQNGLKDLISGIDGEVVTGSSAIYDTTEGCYFVKKEGSGASAIEWRNLNMNLYDNASDYLQVSYLMEHKTTKGYLNNCSQTLYPCIYNRGLAANIGSSSNYKNLNTWYKRCITFYMDGNHQTKMYCDGNVDWFITHNARLWSSLTTPYLGVEWQNMGPWSTDYNNHWAYLKNIMIFNKYLTQDEIRQIQNIQ